MSWIAFFILAYAAVALQAGLGAYVNFGLLAVVFIALGAQRQSALLGAFVLGAMQDLAMRQTLGLFAFNYGLVALIILRASRLVYRRHPLTHFFLVLLGGVITSVTVLIHSRLRHTPHPAFTPVMYTAVAAPLVIGALWQIQGVFAFKR
jgi:rod shape-determining protein MreD